jgi:hypothetical protein
MSNINRRTFLIGSGTLAVSPTVSELDMLAEGFQGATQLPPPAEAVAPFEWTAAGIRFSFEFLDKRLRIKSILPEELPAMEGMPAPTDVSGVETALLCTGEMPTTIME